MLKGSVPAQENQAHEHPPFCVEVIEGIQFAMITKPDLKTGIKGRITAGSEEEAIGLLALYESLLNIA